MSLTSYRAAPPRVNFVGPRRAAALLWAARLRCRSTGLLHIVCGTTPRQMGDRWRSKRERGAEPELVRRVCACEEGLFLAGPATTYSPGS